MDLHMQENIVIIGKIIKVNIEQQKFILHSNNITYTINAINNFNIIADNESN